MSNADHRRLARAAARAATDRFFVASALAVYRGLVGFDEAQLAAWLSCAVEQVPRLALCRRPDGESAMFAEETQRIAEFAGVDAVRLANLLRAADNLDVLRTTSPAVLMAAQDRERAAEQEGDAAQGPRLTPPRPDGADGTPSNHTQQPPERAP